MTDKERFIDLYKTYIHREGADKLLEYLDSSASDFFTAPASTKFHNNVPGGLLSHSLNVYDCLVSYYKSERRTQLFGLSDVSDETLAVVALLHDICKVNVYKESKRNVKDELPYGHGEKSVYVISGFMRLSREEAFAIRYHMGFSNEDDPRNVGAAFELFPLALALSIADTEATYFVEGKPKKDVL